MQDVGHINLWSTSCLAKHRFLVYFSLTDKVILCSVVRGGYDPDANTLWLLDKAIAEHFNVKPTKSITICCKCKGKGYILVCGECNGTGRCKPNPYKSTDESAGICTYCGGSGNGFMICPSCKGR